MSKRWISLLSTAPIAVLLGALAVYLIGAPPPPQTVSPSFTALEDAALWPPLPLSHGGDVIEIDGRADVIQYTPTGIRRLHGATAKPLWNVELDADDPQKRPAALEKAGIRWSEFVSENGDGRPHVARTTADLNGDGGKDLLCLSRSQPTLLALSGSDGSILWAYRGDDEGRSWGDPVAFDLDGNGVPVFFVVFYSTQRCWLDAIRGDTGIRLWRAEVEQAWYAGQYECDLSPFPKSTFAREITGFPMLVARRAGKVIVSLVAGPTLVEWDARTGERLGEPWPLDRPRTGEADGSSGVTFVGRPLLGAVVNSQFVTLKGGEVLLILRWHAVRRYELMALSLATRETLWETTLRDSPAWWFFHMDWPRVYHDSDGATTILVHNGSTATQCVLEALDGATGQRRWRRRLPIDPRAVGGTYRLDRFLDGPDLDGDGWSEIFVATLGMPHQHDGQVHHYLFVDALSGKDGKTLWTTRLRQPGALGQEQEWPRALRPLAWWQTGNDGWPQLLVPLRPAENNPADEPLTYVVSAASGHIAHVVRGVNSARIADFDGDGVPDLYWFTITEKSRELHTLRGTRSLPSEKETPRRDVVTRTPQEEFADIVARYHLDWVAVAILVAVTLAAVIRRRWLLAVLVLLAVAAMYTGLWWYVQRTLSAERDPRLAVEDTIASLGSQAAVLVAALLLMGLSLWGAWRLLCWLGQKLRPSRSW